MKRVLSHPLIALALGLWLRLFFLFKYPASSGDTPAGTLCTMIFEQRAEMYQVAVVSMVLFIVTFCTAPSAVSGGSNCEEKSKFR